VPREGRELGLLRPVDGEARGEDQEVERERAPGRGHAQFPPCLRDGVHRAAEVEERIRVARHAQRAAVRRRYLLRVDVVADAPFPCIGQVVVPLREAGHARALGLVHRGHGGAPRDQVHAGRAAFERRAGAVHGGRAHADHAHAPARQRGVVQHVGGMRPQAALHALHEGRYLRPAQAVAARGQHHAARQPCGMARGGLHVHLHQAAGARAHGGGGVPVAHVGPGHAAVPAQVVHPLQARNLVERVPGLAAPLGLEPCAEGERRHAQRGAGELLGRAQGLHARRGGPGALVVGGGAVQQHGGHALLRQRHAGRQARLAGADDEHVDDGLPAVAAGGQPGAGAPVEGQQVVREAFFEGGQAGHSHGGRNRHGRCGCRVVS